MKIGAALWCAHLCAALAVYAIGEFVSLGSLLDTFLLGTVYLPLVPWRMANVPVLVGTHQMFPSPTLIGWFLVGITWAVLYVAIGLALSRWRARH